MVLIIDVLGAGHGAAHNFCRSVLILARLFMVDELKGLRLRDRVTVADNQSVILQTEELSVAGLHADHLDAQL